MTTKSPTGAKTGARTARPSRLDIAGSTWTLMNHAQHVAIMEGVLTRAGVSVPAAKGEGVAQRARALWTLCENHGLELAAEAEAPALPKGPVTAPETAAKARDLWAEFNAIADPGERTAFYFANRDAFLALARK